MGVGKAICRLNHDPKKAWTHFVRIEKVLDEELVKVSTRSIDRRRTKGMAAPKIKTIAANGLIDFKRYQGRWVPALVTGKGNQSYLSLIAAPDLGIDLLSWFHVRQCSELTTQLYRLYENQDCLALFSMWPIDDHAFYTVNESVIRLTASDEDEYRIDNGIIDIDVMLPQSAIDGIHHMPVRRIIDSDLIPPQTIAVAAFARQDGTRIQYDVETVPLKKIFGHPRLLVTRKQGQMFTVRDPVLEGENP